jgi:hypothetical protein
MTPCFSVAISSSGTVSSAGDDSSIVALFAKGPRQNYDHLVR